MVHRHMPLMSARYILLLTGNCFTAYLRKIYQFLETCMRFLVRQIVIIRFFTAMNSLPAGALEVICMPGFCGSKGLAIIVTLWFQTDAESVLAVGSVCLFLVLYTSTQGYFMNKLFIPLLFVCAASIALNVSGMKEEKEETVFLKTDIEISSKILHEYLPHIRKCCDTKDVKEGKNLAGSILLETAWGYDRAVSIEKSNDTMYSAAQQLVKAGLLDLSQNSSSYFRLVYPHDDLRSQDYLMWLIQACLVNNDQGGVSFGDPEEKCPHIMVLTTGALIHAKHYEKFYPIIEKHCDGETTKTARLLAKKILLTLACVKSKKFERNSDDSKVLHKLLQDGLVTKTFDNGTSYKLNPYVKPLVKAALISNKRNEIHFVDPVKQTYEKILETSSKKLE